MGLRNLSFPVATVTTPGGDFTVRGLSLDHILTLFSRHRGEMSSLFDRFGSAGNVALSDVMAIAMALVDGAPALLAEAIAIAAGGNPRDEENWLIEVEFARNLPFPVQVDALEKIAGQTFSSDMPPGKLFAVVIKALQGTTAAINGPAA